VKEDRLTALIRALNLPYLPASQAAFICKLI